MNKRIVQLVVRLLAVALAGVAGRELNAGELATLGDVVATGVAVAGALLMLAIDLLMHRAGTGSVFAPPGESAAHGPPTRPAPPAIGWALWPAALLGGLVVLGPAGITGCASGGKSARHTDDALVSEGSPKNLYRYTTDTYTAETDAQLGAADVGPDGTWVQTQGAFATAALGDATFTAGVNAKVARGAIAFGEPVNVPATITEREFGPDGSVVSETVTETESVRTPAVSLTFEGLETDAAGVTMAEADRLARGLLPYALALEETKRVQFVEAVRAANAVAGAALDAMLKALVPVP